MKIFPVISHYYALTKPGIIMGNAITATAGFALAARGNFDWILFLVTLLGLALVIASSCVFNNYIDVSIDEKMVRTKNRPLVIGVISGRNALIFATFLGVIGTVVLSIFTNIITVSLALAGVFIYVVLYGIGKRRSKLGTVIGSFAGAVPAVVGYCAVSNSFDAGALILFMIVMLWQMPHFYAIALYRLNEYAAASIPVLPAVKGIYCTKVQMLLYIMAFILATQMLTFFGYTGYVYLAVTSLLGLAWLWFCIQGFQCANDTKWARKMFLFSLVIIMALSIMIVLDVQDAALKLA